MSAREFVDTNVLVYAEDARDADKRARARDLVGRLMREGRGVLSLQVLQEFFAVATRKLGMDPESARRRLLLYSRFEVIDLSLVDLFAAVDLHLLHGVSFWDGLIVRAALNGNCRTLHSEDMQGGRVIEHLTIENPFAATG